MTIYLETKRLLLRDWKAEDKAPFASINADPIIMEYFPRTLHEDASNGLVKRFQKHLKDNGYGPYVLELKETGDFIGFAGLLPVTKDLPFSPATEIAWRLDYGFWGQGYATEAAKAVLDDGFHKHSLKEILAYAVHDNSGAIRIMEKLGMKRDEKADFKYPGLSANNPLGNFVLYRLKKKDFKPDIA